jgi:hypothetical protein
VLRTPSLARDPVRVARTAQRGRLEASMVTVNAAVSAREVIHG